MLAVGRKIGRLTLRTWGRSTKAPGWYYQVFERWGPRLAEDKCQPAILPNGCRMDCDLRDHIQRHIYFMGAYEPAEAYLFTRLLKPGMIVIDAGANVGQYTLLAAKAVGSSGAVYSFEPMPDTFARLEHHITDNNLNNVYANCAALWHEPGTLRLGLAPDMLNNTGAYSVGISEAASTVQAVAFRLDDYTSGHGIKGVGLVKMDIEGTELFALQGMLSVLRRDRPILLVEINRAAMARLGYSAALIWDLLVRDLGYRAWAISYCARACQAIPTLDRIEQQNILFHIRDLPSTVTKGWTLKSVLRWARGVR